MQICTKCTKEKNDEFFYPAPRTKRGFSTICKECNGIAGKEKRRKKKEIQASKSFINQKKILEIGEFFIPNIILVGIGRTQTYQNKCLKCGEEFFLLNRHWKVEELFCDFCEIEIDQIQEKNKSHVKCIGNIIGWKQVVAVEEYKRVHRNYKKVYERDKYTCQYCGYNLQNATEFLALHIDHIKPHSAGGGNSMDNMCVACEKCNLKASNKWFADFQDKKEFIING